MDKKLKFNKKMLLILVSIFLLVIIPLLSYSFLIPRFHIKDFFAKTEVSFQSEFKANPGNICYGNIFSCKDVQVYETGSVDTNKLGSYDVVYTFSYGKEQLKKEQKVEVIDKEMPVLSVEEADFTFCPNGNVGDYKASAVDNYDGDISDKVIKMVEGNEIVFKVSDSSGNTAIVRKSAIKKDDEKPVLSLNGDAIMYLPLNGEYKEQGANATDNCDGDLSEKIEVTGNVDTSKSGEYKVTYKIVDLNGNESILERSIWVYASNDYNAPDGKSIYLTFDDGPGPYTEELLDILKKYDVKATFFVTDQNLTKGYDNAIKRAYEEGHTIGLHSATHNYGYIYSSVDNYFNDLYAIQSKVYAITGFRPMLIRFPGGGSNTVSKTYDNGTKIMSQLTKAVEAKGFRYFDWNVVSGDAGETTNTARVVSNVINALGSKSTYVVLQHDIKKFSVDAVEAIIQFGLSHGYTFRALTMTSPEVHHRVNN